MSHAGEAREHAAKVTHNGVLTRAAAGYRLQGCGPEDQVHMLLFTYGCLCLRGVRARERKGGERGTDSERK